MLYVTTRDIRLPKMENLLRIMKTHPKSDILQMKIATLVTRLSLVKKVVGVWVSV